MNTTTTNRVTRLNFTAHQHHLLTCTPRAISRTYRRNTRHERRKDDEDEETLDKEDGDYMQQNKTLGRPGHMYDFGPSTKAVKELCKFK